MNNYEKMKNLCIEDMAKRMGCIMEIDESVVCKFYDTEYGSCEACCMEWLRKDVKENDNR